MHQAIHIFKKDVRQLWYQFAAVLLAAVGLVFNESLRVLEPEALLVILWCFLIVRLVHTEPLTGDSQFWCTRPYRWTSLIAAKVISILLFINLPLAVAQMIILHRNGFSILSQLPGLLWDQFLVVVVIVLPVAALATVTTGLVQWIGAMLVGVIGFSVLAPKISLAAFGWIPDTVELFIMTICAIIIFVWQYRQRKTGVSRLLLAGSLAATLAIRFFMPWNSVFSTQAAVAGGTISSQFIHPQFDLRTRWRNRASAEKNGQATIEIPISISDVPADVDLHVEALTLSIDGPNGQVWRPAGRALDQFDERSYLSLHTTMDAAAFNRLRSIPVTVRATLFATLFKINSSSNVPVGGQPTSVPGVGLCSATIEDFNIGQSSGVIGGRIVGPEALLRIAHRYLVRCQTPFQWPHGPILALGTNVNNGLSTSYAPYPASLTLNPVIAEYSAISTSIDNESQINVTASQPIAIIRRDFELKNFRLDSLEPQPQAQLYMPAIASKP